MALAVPERWGGAIDEWCRKLAHGVNGILDGRTNNTGKVTLSAGAGNTAVTDLRVGASSWWSSAGASRMLTPPTPGLSAAPIGGRVLL